MIRMLLMGLFLWTGILGPAYAGEIRDIRVKQKDQKEVQVVIDGTYDSYRAFTLQSPFRFVIDLEGARLGEGLDRTVELAGPVVSRIRTGEGEGRSRVVLEGNATEGLFHSNIQEEQGNLVITCWSPKEAKEAAPPEAEAAPEGRSAAVLPTKTLSDLFGYTEQAAPTEETEQPPRIAAFTGEKITLDFYKTDIHNVFRLFSEISGKNMVVDENVKGELTLALKEVPWDLALDIILDVKNLQKEEKLNTFIISPRPATVGEKGKLVVHKVSDEALQPARLRKKEKDNRQKAQEFIVKAHNLEAQGKGEEALKDYEQALALWKGNPDLVKKTSYLHFVSGNFARSYFYAGEALKMNPQDSEAALYGALSALKMGKEEEAEALFEMALAGTPKTPEAFYNYGLFLERRGSYAKSLEIYREYEKLFGPSLRLGLAIAGLHEAQGEIRKACGKYRELQFSGFSMGEEDEEMIRTKVSTLCR